LGWATHFCGLIPHNPWLPRRTHVQEQFQDRFVAVISRTSQPERQQQQQQQQTKNTQETTKNNQYYGDLTVINRDLIKKINNYHNMW
jgi:hypothetical protein